MADSKEKLFSDFSPVSTEQWMTYRKCNYKPPAPFFNQNLGSQVTGDRRLLDATEKKMTQKLNQVYLTSLKKFIAKREKDPALQSRVFRDIVQLLEQQANDRDLLAALNNEPRWTGMIGRTLCRITANLFFDYERDGAQR